MHSLDQGEEDGRRQKKRERAHAQVVAQAGEMLGPSSGRLVHALASKRGGFVLVLLVKDCSVQCVR